MQKNKIQKALNIRVILEDILHNLLYIIAGTIAVAIIASIYTKATYKPKYTTEVSMAVEVKENGNLSQASYYYAIKLAVAYSDVISDGVTKDKIEELSEKELKGVSFSASSITDSHIIVVKCTASDPVDSYNGMKTFLENYGSVTEYVSKTMILVPLDVPVTPTEPSNMYSMTRNVGLAAVAAFIVFTAIFAFISYLRDTIKSEDDISGRLDVNYIGSVVEEKKGKRLSSKKRSLVKALLITNEKIGFEFVENINKLASYFEHQSRSGKKSFMFSSFGSNEGKSTIVANVAMSLAESGYRVVILDADLRNPSQYRIFDIDPEGRKSMIDYMDGNCALEEALIHQSKHLYILPTFTYVKNSAELLDSDEFSSIIDKLAEEFDFVFVDSPPTAFVADAVLISERCDASALVVFRDAYGINSILSTVESLENASKDFLGCILNGAQAEGSSGFGYSHYGYYGKYNRYDNDKREGGKSI